MAEFCLDCFNKANGTNYTKKDLKISKDLDHCEGCGQLRPVVDGFRSRKWQRFLLGTTIRKSDSMHLGSPEKLK